MATPDTQSPPRKKPTPKPSKTKQINLRRLTEWQGQRVIPHSNRISFHWDKDKKRYFPVSSNPKAPRPDERRYTGIYYTYFSAIGAYPVVPVGVAWFYSNDIFGRAVYRSNDGRLRQGIRPTDYNGLIPFKKFDDELNEYLGTTDWKTAFREVEYRFEQGVSIYIIDSEGRRTLRKFPIPNTIRSERTYSKERAKEIDKARKQYRRKRATKRGERKQ